MKLSVIIPTLNEAKLLPQLLEQLNNIRELHPEVEIIISDGGSKDETLQIAESYNCIIIRNSENNRQNIAMGRNLGAAQTEAPLLLFLNADVRFESPGKFFEFCLNVFPDSEYAAMTCYVKTFPEETTLADTLFHGFYNFYFIVLNKIGVGMGRGECQLLKRDYFINAEGYNPELAAGEDFDLFRRIKAAGGKIFFNKALMVYESPRRYRKIGYWGVALLWTKNALSILLKNKSISKVWEQVR